MACPFFVPSERADDLAFPHPARLPLGAAWRGTCGAPGHELAVPTNAELEACNLGYAATCSRLPAQRKCDAVRFGVVKESSVNISVQVVFEAKYRPAGRDFLDFDPVSNTWSQPHSDLGIQTQAERFLRAYLERKARKDQVFNTECTESTMEATEPL